MKTEEYNKLTLLISCLLNSGREPSCRVPDLVQQEYDRLVLLDHEVLLAREPRGSAGYAEHDLLRVGTEVLPPRKPTVLRILLSFRSIDG